MTGEGSHDFARVRRIVKTDEFSSVFRLRPAQKTAHFVLYTRPNTLPHARLGVVAAKRFAPRAVTRNTIKRITRELFRTMPSLPSTASCAWRGRSIPRRTGHERGPEEAAACRAGAPVRVASAHAAQAAVSASPVLPRRCAGPLRTTAIMKTAARLAVARLPGAGIADARAELPFLSELFQLRDRSAAPAWRRARRLAGRAPRLPLPSVERRRQ
jgi:ribonuclease P protein component